jgi:hypothetical protein
VAGSEFQATWVPRIGEEATAELRLFRRTGSIGIVAPVFAVAAGLLFARNNALDDLLAVVCAVVGISFIVAFINGQRRLAKAMSYWFGVRIQAGQMPPMSVGRFDTWREKRGLRAPDKRASGPDGRVPLESLTLMRWDFPAPPALWPGEQMLWSGIGYMRGRKGWLEGTLYVTTGRIMFVPARLGNLWFNPPEVQRFQLSDLVSVKLEDQGSAPEAGRERQRLEFTLQGEQSLLIAVDEADETLAELRALLGPPGSVASGKVT